MQSLKHPQPFDDKALSNEYPGLAKIRLVHGRGKSLILVDALVIEGEKSTYWLQPQWQYGHQIIFTDDDAFTTLRLAAVDRHGKDVPLEFEIWSSQRVRSLPDRSEIYRTVIRGPEGLSRFKAGIARVRDDEGVDLRLFHHTKPQSKTSILRSEEVWGSRWNFGGTRSIANGSYAYFTSLPVVDTEERLVKIAMASSGRLPLVLDQNLAALWPDVVIDVYRGSTRDRTATVSLWVPAEHVAPSHFFEHHTQVVEYESAHPWIFRVGLIPEGKYRFAGDAAHLEQSDLRRFEYVILGDCRTEEGLMAPYDEEATTATFELADLAGGSAFDYWRANANQQLFDGDVERQLLDPPAP